MKETQDITKNSIDLKTAHKNNFIKHLFLTSAFMFLILGILYLPRHTIHIASRIVNFPLILLLLLIGTFLIIQFFSGLWIWFDTRLKLQDIKTNDELETYFEKRKKDQKFQFAFSIFFLLIAIIMSSFATLLTLHMSNYYAFILSLFFYYAILFILFIIIPSLIHRSNPKEKIRGFAINNGSFFSNLSFIKKKRMEPKELSDWEKDSYRTIEKNFSRNFLLLFIYLFPMSYIFFKVYLLITGVKEGNSYEDVAFLFLLGAAFGFAAIFSFIACKFLRSEKLFLIFEEKPQEQKEINLRKSTKATKLMYCSLFVIIPIATISFFPVTARILMTISNQLIQAPIPVEILFPLIAFSFFLGFFAIAGGLFALTCWIINRFLGIDLEVEKTIRSH